MVTGSGALGQFALGQSATQVLAIQPSLFANTNTFYSVDIGHQYVYPSAFSNSSMIYQRVGFWNVRAKDAETWTRAA